MLLQVHNDKSKEQGEITNDNKKISLASKIDQTGVVFNLA
jgi:hypothetical protein